MDVTTARIVVRRARLPSSALENFFNVMNERPRPAREAAR